jgi:heme/copper-type cytochrome/quinol oxidase subunit 2
MIRFREIFTRRQAAGPKSLFHIRSPRTFAAKWLILCGLLPVVSGCHRSPADNRPPDVVKHMITMQWAILPGRIEVKQGQEVELIVSTPDVEHGLAIKGYGISEPVQPGEPTVIKFLADKAGTFRMSCDILCGRGHKDMVGELIVLPAGAESHANSKQTVASDRSLKKTKADPAAR